MDRKGFLKNIFGAAVVMAMPKIVVGQIETLPEPITPVNGVPLIIRKEGIIIHPQDVHMPYSNDCLFIYDSEKLIAQSFEFEFNFRQNVSPVYSKSKWVKEWTGKYKKKNGKKKYKWVEKSTEGIPDYWAAPREWDIKSRNIQWFVNPEEIFAQGNKLNCLIKRDQFKITGNIYIKEIDASLSYMEGIYHSAKFIGCGSFIME